MDTRGDLRALGSAVACYALFYAAFFAQGLLTSNLIAPSDSLDFGVAAFLSAPALWTGGMFSGYPIAADPQALTWYPLLHLFRATGLGWNAFMVASYVMASATCFLLVRRLTGSTLAGAFGGIVYGFSGVMLAHISHFNQIHAAAWLPLVVYGLQLTREGRHGSGVVVTATAYGLMWTAGHPQLAVYTAYLSLAVIAGWLVLDRPGRPLLLRQLGWSAVAMAAGVGLAAVSVLPMIELGELSRRAGDTWELYVSKPLAPDHLLSLVFPLAFGGFVQSDGSHLAFRGESSPGEMTGYLGMLPLALGFVAPFLMPGIRRESRLWVVLGLVAVLLCLGAATPLGRLFYYAPGYAAFRVPARHLFVVTFCVAVASGFAFEQIIRRTVALRAAAVAIAITALIGVAAGALYLASDPAALALLLDHREYALRAVAWPLTLAAGLALVALAGSLIGARGAAATVVAALVLGVVHVAEVSAFHYVMPGYRFTYAEVPAARTRPHPGISALGRELRRTGDRVLAADGSRNRFLLPNLPRAWNVPAASGSGALGIERYLDMFDMGGPGDVSARALSDQHRALDLFGVRYVFVSEASGLARELKNRPARWSAVDRVQYSDTDPDTAYTIFRNARALPRAWCAQRVVAMSGNEALQSVRTGDLSGVGGEFDPAKIALVEKGDAPERVLAAPDAPRGEVITVPRDGNGGYRYLVTSSTPCFLVLSEVYYPWWRASVDGTSASLVRTNHAMLGLSLPAGTHVVRLWLQPTSVWAGGAISVLTLLALVAVGSGRVRGFRRARPSIDADPVFS